MYFYALKKTKAKFMTTGFSDQEALPYIIAFAALGSIAPVFYLSPQNTWDHVTTALSTLLAIISTVLLYRANGGAIGRNFISKYIILGWVLVVRSITFFLIPFLILFILGYFLGYTDGETTHPFDVIAILIFEIALYIYLYIHFADLRKMELAEQDAAANS